MELRLIGTITRSVTLLFIYCLPFQLGLSFKKIIYSYRSGFYGKPFYYLLCKIDILYVISDILYRILDILYSISDI